MIIQLDTHPECQSDEHFVINTATVLRVGDIAYRRDGSILPGYHPIFAKEPQIPCNISHSAATKIADSLPTSCQFELAARLKIIEALARPGATDRYSIESVEDYTKFIRSIFQADCKIAVTYFGDVHIFNRVGEVMCKLVDKHIVLSSYRTRFRETVEKPSTQILKTLRST